MTEPSPSRPVPGPPRPVPGPAPAAAPSETGQSPEARPASGESAFAHLDEQPVSEHVAVFEAEHSRLQRELGTIDQL
jgi:hypothetical protein